MADTTILVAADARWVRDQVRAAFVGPGQEVIEVSRGQDVRNAFAESEPDLVILDMQIGNMGGIAVAIDLRLEESADRLERATILLLLDREADRLIASRADADAELLKPVDAGMLRRTATALLEAVAAAASAELDEDDDAEDADAPPGDDDAGAHDAVDEAAPAEAG